MKLKQLALSAVLGAALTAPAMAQEVLTGDKRLACEAILCLSSGKRPDECVPSLKRYFDISYRKWSDTVSARKDFLKLCPSASQDSNMQKLTNAIAAGAGRCDSASLNSTLTLVNYDAGTSMVSNQMPDYCTAYTTNAYTDLSAYTPVYVGVPERGGYWVDPAQYQQALAQYNARIAAEDAASASSGGG